MIRIGIDPNMFSLGNFVLTWHGFFTFVGVALAVYLVSRWAKREDIHPDIVYSTAVWGIIGGILGARIIHVIDRWDFYGHNLQQIPAIWNGGIAIYGAILGGFLGGFLYSKFRDIPVGKLADITAPALLISQAIGRIGDIINGEHLANTTTMPWGFIYSHPYSLSNQYFGLTPSHPAVVYEMIWDLILVALIWPMRRYLRPHGMTFVAYLALYALGRFFIQFLRMDRVWVVGLSQAHIISIVVLAIAVPLLAYKAQWLKSLPKRVQTRKFSSPQKPV